MHRRIILLCLIALLVVPTTFAQTDDGHQVIYMNDAGEVVALNPRSGEQMTLLTITDAAHPAFGFHVSPDGEYLAAFVRFADGASLRFHLYVTRIADGQLLLDQNLLPDGYTYPTTESLGDPSYELTRALGEVAWSPTSGHLAFISAHEGSADMFTYEPATGTLTQRNAAPQTAAFLHWNPTGDTLVFAELVSFGDGSGYQVDSYYRFSLGDNSVIPIPLPEPASSTGISMVGWQSPTLMLYSPLNFQRFGASGLYLLDLSTLETQELLPVHIAMNVPVYDDASRAVAFVVPDVGEVNLVPGAYLLVQGDATPTLLKTGPFYTVQRIRPDLFQFDSAEGSYVLDPTSPELIPLAPNDFGAYISPQLDAVALARADGVYVSHVFVDDAVLVWPEETQVPIWSPDGAAYYSFGFTPEGAGLVEVDVANRSVRLLDDRMAINSPRAVAP